MTKVLIVDDSEVIRGKLRAVLGDHPGIDEIVEASDGAQGFKLLVEGQVDLVLCDLVMPTIDGFKFLKLKSNKEELGDVPVLMLTSAEQVAEKVRGLKEGAADYITKPFNPEELVARVDVHLRLKKLQDELREKNAQLEALTRTDALTGTANRRHFMEKLETEFRRSKRYGWPLGVIMTDLDHFKSVNDNYGHQVGDRALVAAAGVLAETVREHDLVGRYGGEEFAVILPETDLEGTRIVAERCRERIEASDIDHDGQRVPVTASMGIAAGPAAAFGSPARLVRFADEALLDAKTQGRNRVIAAETPPVPEGAHKVYERPATR